MGTYVANSAPIVMYSSTESTSCLVPDIGTPSELMWLVERNVASGFLRSRILSAVAVVRAYVPPKMAAMPYDEDDSAVAKRQRKEEKERAKFLNSEMMQELRSEFSTRPEEVSHRDTFKDKVREAMEEREKVEEDRFVRIGGRKKLLKKRQRTSAAAAAYRS